MAVGDASKAGDAIVVRYGTDTSHELMLIDGGHLETGERLVRHIRREFGPTPILSHVVLTHADADHASGLREVIAEVPTRNLWMHVPWFHAPEALSYFADKTLSA